MNHAISEDENKVLHTCSILSFDEPLWFTIPYYLFGEGCYVKTTLVKVHELSTDDGQFDELHLHFNSPQSSDAIFPLLL